jgi:hypothetical protein
MAWLIACPHHKTGIFGLLFFFIVLFYQPALHGTTEQNNFNKRNQLFLKTTLRSSKFFSSSYIHLEMNLYHHITYSLFVCCALYAASFLPYGRFYNRLGGNIGMLGAYMYTFVYLGFNALRRPLLLEALISSVMLRSRILRVFTARRAAIK